MRNKGFLIGLTIVLTVLMIATAIFCVGLNRYYKKQNKSIEVVDTTYKIGAFDIYGNEDLTVDSSYITASFINSDSFKLSVEDNSQVVYKVYFYNSEKEFISETPYLAGNFSNKCIPTNCGFCKVLVKPLNIDTVDLDNMLLLCSYITIFCA